MRLCPVLFIFCVSCFFGTGTVWADCLSDPGHSIDSLNQLPFNESKEGYRLILDRNESTPEHNACIQYHFGRLLFHEGELEAAYESFSSGAAKLEGKGLLAHKLCYNSGILQLRLHGYIHAIDWFKRARQAAINEVDIQKCNIKIAKCYRESGELFLANYYLKIAAKGLISKASGTRWLMEAYGNLGINYNEASQPDSALYYLGLQRNLIDKDDSEQWAAASITNHLESGNAHETKKQYNEAILYYQASLRQAQINGDLTNQYRNYNNLGYLYNQTGEFESALAHLNKSKSIATNQIKDSLSISFVAGTIGDTYLGQGAYQEAIEQHYKALTLILPASKSNDFNLLPSMRAMMDLDYLHEIYMHCKDLTGSIGQYGLKTGREKIIRKALEYVSLSDSILFHINRNNIDERSKFFWRKEAQTLYSFAIELSIALDDHETAFEFLERNKYFVLQSLITENKLLTGASAATGSDIAGIRDELSQIEISGSLKRNDPGTLSRYVDLKEMLHLKMSGLTELNVSFFDPQPRAKISELQDHTITDDSTLYITYHIANENLHVMYVAHDSSWIRSPDFGSRQERIITEFLDLVSRPFQTTSDEAAFYSLSNTIYQFLLTDAIADYNSLVINPSGFLSYIPFDALCSNLANKTMVINDHAVRYMLTPSFGTGETVNANNGNTLIVAPVEFNHPGLTTLPYTEAEAKNVARITKGKILSGSGGTKTAFLKALPQYDNIHMATHAQSGGDKNGLPWLAFQDEKIYLPEIYNLDLENKFIVLSACETFKGESLEGEGILSLVWALHYSGSRSMVATLWNAYDNSQNEIMGIFYDELISGKSHEQALRSAKLKYMDLHRTDPCYWASPIFIGTAGSFNTAGQAHRKLPIATILAVLFGLLILIFVRKNMNSPGE